MPTVLVGIGDSITRGSGSTPFRSYFHLLVKNNDEQYPDMAGRDLAHVFPDLATCNLSTPATESEHHLRSQVPSIRSYPETVRGIVVITFGGNDLIHDYGESPPRDGAVYGCTYSQVVEWSGNFRRRLRSIIEGVTGKFPGGCEIFLANIYDPTDGVGDIEDSNVVLPP